METKRVAGDEQQLIVRIELIVRVAIVVVEPPAIVVAFNVEHTKIAIRVGIV